MVSSMMAHFFLAVFGADKIWLLEIYLWKVWRTCGILLLFKNTDKIYIAMVVMPVVTIILSMSLCLRQERILLCQNQTKNTYRTFCYFYLLLLFFILGKEKAYGLGKYEV